MQHEDVYEHGDLVLPRLRFPLTASISDRSGQFLLVEISEDLTVN